MGKYGKWMLSGAAVVALGALGMGGLALLRESLAGPLQNDMPLDAATRNATIDAAIGALGRYYVFPDKAAAVGQQLRAQAGQGAFDGVTSAEELAETLTDELQRLTQDRHLAVRYFEQPLAELALGQDESPEEKAQEYFGQMRLNFGFETVGRLHGNIGYLDLHAFGRPQFATARIAAAMALLADTKALIIDLRRCGGGDPETVMQVASYLYNRRTHLNDIYWRDEGRIEERWTADTVAGKPYGQARRIYLLTSGDTFSGGEDFAYALKNSGRATLVGETTGGGANAGSPRRLGAHFMMFVPTGRPISPVTHSNWEGVGVTPDLAVAADDALEVAHLAVVKELLATETDPRWKDILQSTLAELD